MAAPELPLEAHLIRDAIAWLEEKGRVPMLLAARSAVSGEMPGVPEEAEHVVLNVSSRAIRHLDFGPESLSFTTGFGPVRATLVIPYAGVLQIASGNDEGFVGVMLRREAEVPGKSGTPEPTPEASAKAAAKRRFRVVRDDES